MATLYSIIILTAWIGTPLVIIKVCDKSQSKRKAQQSTHFMRG